MCECEEVSVGEVEYALNELDVNNLVDLRGATRVGMDDLSGRVVRLPAPRGWWPKRASTACGAPRRI